MPLHVDTLVEMVSKLDEPDRHVDLAIAEFLGVAPMVDDNDPWGWHKERFAEDPTTYSKPDDMEGKRHVFWCAKAYTKSVDAAIELLPQGYFVQVVEGRQGRWRVQVWHVDTAADLMPTIDTIHNSEALARTMAGLLARKHLDMYLEAVRVRAGTGEPLV